MNFSFLREKQQAAILSKIFIKIFPECLCILNHLVLLLAWIEAVELR